MDQYSEYQKKQDLAVLGIEEGSNITSRLLTVKYKNLARILHPDRKGGNKEAFQKLKNAYDRLTAMLDWDQCEKTEDDYEKQFF